MELVVQELPTPQFSVYGASCSRTTYTIVCILWSQLFKNCLLHNLEFMEVVVHELPTPQFAVYGGSCLRTTYSIVCSLWRQLFKNYLLHSLQFMELVVKELPSQQFAVYGASSSGSRSIRSPMMNLDVQQKQSLVSHVPETCHPFPGDVGEHFPPLRSHTRLLEKTQLLKRPFI